MKETLEDIFKEIHGGKFEEVIYVRISQGILERASGEISSAISKESSAGIS